MGKGLSIVADIFEFLEIGDDFTLSKQFHKEVMLIRIEVVEDEVFTIVD